MAKTTQHCYICMCIMSPLPLSYHITPRTLLARSWIYFTKLITEVCMGPLRDLGFRGTREQRSENGRNMGTTAIMGDDFDWAEAWQNQQNDTCARRRRSSAWASAQSNQSLGCCSQLVAKGPRFLHAGCEYWVDAQAELSLRWAHGSFCWFCRSTA